MEMHNLIDLLLGIVVLGSGWFIREMSYEIKRLNILLNKTREDYATKIELHNDIDRVMEALHRVEDKLDKVLTK